MSPTELRKVMRAFKPFVIHLSDGRNFEVPNPEWVFLTPSQKSLFIHDRDGSFEIVNLRLITSVEVPAHFKPKAKKQNGA